MSSSDSDPEEDFVLYRDREDWKDVVPVPQDDGPAPVVAIAYSDRFRDVYDYFRAILKSDERSQRALDLTTDAISLNAANYTVWHFRRVLLKSLKKDLNEELDYVGRIIRHQPKNYQVWYHRGIIVQWLNDSSKELAFTEDMLREDAKNYHCWQHRQLVLNCFRLWDGEVEFTSRLLESDLRNNSAWNQRFYAYKNTTKFGKDVLEKEVGFAVSMIKKAPNNESAWNYLKGVLAEGGGLHTFVELKDDFERMLTGGCDSPYLVSFLVDFYTSVLEVEDNSDVASRAISLCNLLADDIDYIRREYWSYVKRSLQSKYGQSEMA